MSKEQILNVIKDLAKSQGFYSRLLEDITNEQLAELKAQHFADVVDLVLFLES